MSALASTLHCTDEEAPMHRVGSIFLCVCAVVANGCGKAAPRVGGDGHFDVPSPDAGHGDGGGTQHADAGTRRADAGSRTADAGQPVIAPPTCSTDLVPAPVTAGCTDADLTCLDACTTDACAAACFAASPACGDCVDRADVACVNAHGCQAQWDAGSCCRDTCADPTSAACDTACASVDAAYEACATGVGAACDAATDVCFPP